MQLFIGIDIGTQGTKTACYDESGRCVAEAFRGSRHLNPAPGVLEEDPEEQLAAAVAALRQCFDQTGVHPSAVAAIALAGQMAGIIGVGEDGRAITPYDSWLDTRCGRYIERMRREAEDEVLTKTGNVPSFNHGPKLLWWKHERPAEYARIRAFVQPAAYVAMRLCGLAAAGAFIDPTYLHFSGFADNPRLQWDDALCARFEIDSTKLPRIVSSTAVVGRISGPFAHATGLLAGTPVVAGCGDTAASFLACGATREGISVDVAGTASVFAATSATFVPDTRGKTLGCGRSVLPGLWHPYAYINGGGQNLEWYRHEILGERMTLAELDTLAASTAEEDRLPYFVPHLSGRVSPAWPHLRGSWVGVTRETNALMLFRAVLESVALEYALYRRALLALRPDFAIREVRVTGGGERSRTWNQLKADRLQTRVVSVARSGGAAMGAALVAAHGVGAVADLTATVARWIRLGPSCTPHPAFAQLSERRVARYASLLEKLNQWTEEQ